MWLGEIACFANSENYDAGNSMLPEGSPKPDRLKGRGQTNLTRTFR